MIYENPENPENPEDTMTDPEIDRLRDELAEAEATIHALHTEVGDLREKYERYQHEAAALERLHDGAVAERDRLRAELAEAEATILNERGEGEAPCEGWVPFFEVDGEVEDATVCITRWMCKMDGGLVCYAGVNAFQGGAWWAVNRKVDRRTVFLRSGDEDTVRVAMRAATVAVKGGDGG